ncbi:MAG: ribonuclease activity regulator RraA, partial [Kiloniellaceae bacterium]
RGIRRTWMDGPRPLDPARARFAGEAYTLRFLPLREDLGTPESYARPGSLREAIEAMPPGRVAVVDARGERGCGTIGDILLLRMKVRGTVAFVTDGALRDIAGVREVGLPTFCAAPAAPPSIAGLVFAGWEQPIGCGGVAVLPGDVVAGDEDGVVVVPRALADEIAEAAPEQERFERFALMRVRRGDPVLGLYPPNEDTLTAYRAWLDAGEPEE